MTAFLVVLVIILFGVAVWQMGKIFQLSKGKADDSSQIANDKDNNVNGWLMLMFVLFIYALSAISFMKWGDVLLPQSASEHGVDTDNLMLISMVLIFIVGIIIFQIFGFSFFKLWCSVGSLTMSKRQPSTQLKS